MRTKVFIIVLLAALVGVVALVVSGDNEDQGIVDQLARRQQQRAPAESLEPTGEQYQPAMFQLNDVLKAERDDMRRSWFVNAEGSRTYVELPFPPTIDGVLPSDESSPSEDSSEESGAPAAAAAAASGNPGFLGAQACAECHQQKHDGFVHTAHHKTSGVVDPETVNGHFDPPRNVLRTRDKNLSFTMTQRDGRCFQEVSFSDWKLEFPLDVFTGSAKAGQTFLYWHRGGLFQAYVSYLNEFDEWIPSPGYDDWTVRYSRRIRPGCLECHVTYIDVERLPNFYDRQSAVWGISCERCHGPGLEHVEYHREHPDEKSARHIVNPVDLPRQGQLDICGQCHSGSFDLLGDVFSYQLGDDLDKHHRLLHPDSEGVGGIHTSDQLKRLKMSKCFQESEMTCASCHNPHENQRGDTAAFTKSCLDCHQIDHCGMAEQLGDKVAENCIDCHMPMGDNEGMTLTVSGGKFTMTMIDHYIRIDEESTERYLAE